MTPEQLAAIRAHYADQSEAVNPGHNVTVNALLDHIAQLEAQRGGAVVVPAKMDDDDWEAIGFQQSTEGQLQRVWDRAVSRIQPIPADLVLGEGMVGVDREERDLLGRLHMVAMQFVMDADPAQRRSAAHLVQAVAALRQYESRSAKGEAK